MAENSKIGWTDHTFNHIRGCTKVSPACDHCYAETLSKRNQKTLGVWGKYGTRVVASESMWRQPLKWNREARDGVCPKCHGKNIVPSAEFDWQPCDRCVDGKVDPYRSKVFCASLADVFEGRETLPESTWSAVAQARLRLFQLIDTTKSLDWLLLTKRPENISSILHEEISLGTYGEDWNVADHMPNIWLGTTVENQKYADIRIPELLKVPAAVRFLSIEPMLSEIEIDDFLGDRRWWCISCDREEASMEHNGECEKCGDSLKPYGGIDWVILGTESGKARRPMKLEWAESVVDQCDAAGVPVFVKQLEIGGKVTADVSLFPKHLQRQEFPKQGATR